MEHSPSPSLTGPPGPRMPRNGSSTALSVVSDISNNGGRTGGISPMSVVYDDDFRYKTMINYLFKRIVASGWIPSERNSDDCLGVLLRRSRGNYVTAPEPLHHVLLGAVIRLNLAAALTIRPQMLEGILDSLSPGQTELRFKDGSQLQIIDSLTLAQPTNVKKFQYACVCRQERLVLVWQDDIQNIIPQATRIEERLLSLVWGEGRLPFNILQLPTRPPSILSSHMSSMGATTPGYEKSAAVTVIDESDDILEKDLSVERPESLARPVMRVSAVFVGLSIALAICLLFGFYIGKLVSECLLDGTWHRMGLLAPIPLLMFISLFFFQVIFTNIFQFMGPIGGTTTNSRFYSCYKPSLRRAYADGFVPPRVSIQLPVYKEGMESVIQPTVKSLQAAISYYESHGGSANIFVNDDGLRAGISEEEVQRRRDFYHDNNIGWVARPKHDPNGSGFIRGGKFKKASNMNFALNISQKVEGYLQDMVEERMAADNSEYIDENEEEQMYQLALARVLEENPNAWAEGDIRVGEVILIVDSDTRVPVDCLLYGAAEMFLSPEVAIVQHNTGVMQVSWDYFENGITFFTNMVYSSIRFTISCGEVAPFVGHNAFLRWQAIQDVGRVLDDGYVNYWSESHVSEDFDISLRLQMAGNVIRTATYHGDEFKEGVSLTIYDELARWQKYAYGVSEMIFHPMHRWYKGPFTPLFYTFLGSNIMWSSKLSILAYMCSYFALGSAVMLTLLNYFLVGWFRDDLASSYLTSWHVFVSLIVIFNILGHFALAALRYRTGERSFLGSLFENLKWSPMMTCFFGGVSFHISAALLCHLLHIDMQWGATSKEKEESNFFQEMPRIANSFKYMYIFIILVTGGMIYLGVWAPEDWAIRDFTAIVPLAANLGLHALVPLVMNPSLMVFNY